MSGFDTFVMVDWSGGGDTGPRPRKDAIWAAVARGGEVSATYLRNRQVAREWLADVFQAEIAAGRRVLAGFDFPMGYPKGFARAMTGADDPLALWDRLAEELADGDRFGAAARLNGLFPGIGPFWFNGSKVDHPGLPRKGRERTGHGMAERRAVELRAKGTFTCWQLGGAGSVGSQVLTGLAVLAGLRRQFGERLAIWPFQACDAPVVIAEIWPSLLAAEVRARMREDSIRDEVQVRLVAQALAAMQRAGTLHGALTAAEGPDVAEEGWILGVGAEEALRTAAKDVID